MLEMATIFKKPLLFIIYKYMKIKQLSLPSWGLPLVAALALTQVASAVVINYQVTSAGATSPESTLFGPSLQAAGTEEWNIDQWAGSVPTITNMVDSTGAPTGVGITQSGFTGTDDTWNNTASLTLLRTAASAFFNGSGNGASFTITGLTVGATYDLYIASAHMTNPAETIPKAIGDWSTSNVNLTGPTVTMDNTNTVAMPNNQTNGSTWVAGVNYAFFQAVQPDALGRITMTEHAFTPNTTDSRIGFSGFQLISTVPEPTSAMLGGLGLLALLRRRRA